MSFLKSLFKTKEEPIKSYDDFWNWFEQNEKKFFKVLKNQGNIKRYFFNKLELKLNELKEGFWFLAGMFDDNTAELILTADGVIKNIVFVEELVESAPKMSNWKITALKQPSGSNYFGIEMDGYKFDESKLNFYSTVHESMPDEIDITITHRDFNENNRTVITNGVYLALDNSLGELNSITKIDSITIINPKEASKELIPIKKLRDYLSWREKEFVEKYMGFRHNTENDSYSGLEGTLKSGLPLLAVLNMDLLDWDSKASHPWIAVLRIKYNGKNNGMPDDTTFRLMNEIQERIMEALKDSEGYLNIGRQTADSIREIYFACVEFRKPTKVLYRLQKEYQVRIEIDFDIYKDKYWKSFNRFLKK
ncbi:MAG: hypothetical protein Aureis2KO_22260 [Aureisphaera sp.]